jgi:Rieske Fe-S protein
MDRKKFLQTCGLACIGSVSIASIFQSCSVVKMTTGTIEGNNLIVKLSDFETKAGPETHYKKYVVVNNDMLKFPICVFRHNSQTYTAIWLQCTHQGAELQVFGDKLQCPAHGSEFDNEGKVTGGPADKNLRAFPSTIQGEILIISLSK